MQHNRSMREVIETKVGKIGKGQVTREGSLKSLNFILSEMESKRIGFRGSNGIYFVRKPDCFMESRPRKKEEEKQQNQLQVCII